MRTRSRSKNNDPKPVDRPTGCEEGLRKRKKKRKVKKSGAARREIKRLQRQKIQQNPKLHAAAKKKERARWKKRKEKGKLTKSKDLPRRQLKLLQKRRKANNGKYYLKKKQQNQNLSPAY